jgi:hypothetical protein
MRKIFFLLVLVLTASLSAHSQLAVVKMIGKNSDQNKLGFGVFGNYDIPLNDIGNKSLMIELLDLSFFPGKEINSEGDDIARGYISIKLGYRKIFSEESKTGFFVEPQVGYCRVVVVDSREPETKYGDGIAAAFETGYSLETGERGNALLFGLKYEADMAGKDLSIQSIGFRVSYSFAFLRRK